MALDAIPSLNLGCHVSGRGQILFLPLGVKDRDSSCTRLETDGPLYGARATRIRSALCKRHQRRVRREHLYSSFSGLETKAGFDPLGGD